MLIATFVKGVFDKVVVELANGDIPLLVVEVEILSLRLVPLGAYRSLILLGSRLRRGSGYRRALVSSSEPVHVLGQTLLVGSLLQLH